MFDVIVVGARCAGAPTAMLLARQGHRVLLVDRARFPSDTLSTHFLPPRGVAKLAAWGLLDRPRATGCPAINPITFDTGQAAVTADAEPVDGIVEAFCPRRTVLDRLLVDAAVQAGCELRERTSVDGLVWEDGRVAGIRCNRGGQGDLVERYRAGDRAAAVDTFMRGVCGDGYRETLERALPGAFGAAVADADTFFGQELPGLREWPFGPEEASRLRAPALVVLGGDSHKVTPRFEQRQALLLAWLPDAEPFTLTGATHLLHLQNPGGMAAALVDFFERHPLPKARGASAGRAPSPGAFP
jgi:hypothetical protein